MYVKTLIVNVTMLQGKLSDGWAMVTKSAIAEAILNLTKLDTKHRGHDVCPRTPTVSFQSIFASLSAGFSFL
jgi:hypothetical protein